MKIHSTQNVRKVLIGRNKILPELCFHRKQTKGVCCLFPIFLGGRIGRPACYPPGVGQYADVLAVSFLLCVQLEALQLQMETMPYHIAHQGWIAARDPNRIKSSLWTTKENRQKHNYMLFLVFFRPMDKND